MTTENTPHNVTPTRGLSTIALVAWGATEAILRHSQAAPARIDMTQPQWWALNNIVRSEHGLTREEIRALAVPSGMDSQVTDARWARIEPLLPDRTPKRGGRWRAIVR